MQFMMDFELDLNETYSAAWIESKGFRYREMDKLGIFFRLMKKLGLSYSLRVEYTLEHSSEKFIEGYYGRLKDGRYKVLTRFMNYTPFRRSKN